MIYYNMKYIIYKIQIKDYIYIGSTQRFTQRKAQHKRNCINGNELLVYRTIRDNGGWDCCSIIPVKEIEVESKTQAHIAEEEVRIEYSAQMNSIRAYRSKEQQKQDLKEYMQSEMRKEQQKIYRETEEYKVYNQQRRQTEKYKEYCKEYNKRYYLAKKAKLVESPEIKVEA